MFFAKNRETFSGVIMSKIKLRILPNKLFETLWKQAPLFETLEEYTSFFTSPISQNRIRFLEKYNINEEETFTILKSIYDLSNLSFLCLVKRIGVTKSALSHEFCIPIRTIEDWYSGKNKCPSYIRLMIIKNYRLFEFGHFIYLESEIEYMKRKPSVYHKKKEEKETSEFNQKKEQNPSKKRSEEFYSEEYQYLYSPSRSHMSYAELQRHLSMPKEKLPSNLPYEDYLRRKRNSSSKLE